MNGTRYIPSEVRERVHRCAHNRLRAERVFGVAFIQEKIDASRRKPSPNGHADSS